MARQNRMNLRVAIVFQRGFDDAVFLRKTLDNWHKERWIKSLAWLEMKGDKGKVGVSDKAMEEVLTTWSIAHGVPRLIFPYTKIDKKLGPWGIDERLQKMMDMASPGQVLLFGNVDPITTSAEEKALQRSSFVTRFRG